MTSGTTVSYCGMVQADAAAPQAFDAWSDRPLLGSLEKGGIDWPSSCRNGSCRSCIGQLTSGQVRYAIDWPGLSAEEKAAGYFLPCVAFPCSDLTLARDAARS